MSTLSLPHRAFPFFALFASLSCLPRVVAENAPAIFEKTIPAGHRLILVLDQDNPAGETFRKEYFERVFAVAHDQGLYDCHSFRVDEVVAGEKNPRAASFFAWPNPTKSEAFRYSELYTQWGPRRSEGWLELQTFYMDLGSAVTLRFDRTKHYTVAAVWLKDADGYDRYFQATETLRAELGCRVVLKQRVNRYDSVRDGPGTPPDWILLVEWQDREGPAQYINSAQFKEQQALHDAAMGRIEMHRLAFWP